EIPFGAVYPGEVWRGVALPCSAHCPPTDVVRGEGSPREPAAPSKGVRGGLFLAWSCGLAVQDRLHFNRNELPSERQRSRSETTSKLDQRCNESATNFTDSS